MEEGQKRGGERIYLRREEVRVETMQERRQGCIPQKRGHKGGHLRKEKAGLRLRKK